MMLIAKRIRLRHDSESWDWSRSSSWGSRWSRSSWSWGWGMSRSWGD